MKPPRNTAEVALLLVQKAYDLGVSRVRLVCSRTPWSKSRYVHLNGGAQVIRVSDHKGHGEVDCDIDVRRGPAKGLAAGVQFLEENYGR